MTGSDPHVREATEEDLDALTDLAGREGDASAPRMFGAARLITRARLGRPHRFHDVLLVLELAAPVVTETVLASDAHRTRHPVPRR